MLPDRFYEEYAKTANRPPAPEGEAPEEPKDTYTRAEVDDIVNRKIAEAFAQRQPEEIPDKTPANVAEINEREE